jgi:hypothetical protein
MLKKNWQGELLNANRIYIFHVQNESKQFACAVNATLQ